AVAAPDHGAPRAAQRHRAGAGDRHPQSRPRHHLGGDAFLPGRRPALDPAFARHADPPRQRGAAVGRLGDHGVPWREARGARAGGTPPGRLAARRPEPEAALMAATNNPPLLEVRNLRVEFPTRRGTLLAVDDVSFEIAPGEVLGVVSESGAGKSLTG